MRRRYQITHHYGSILQRLRFSVTTRGYDDMGANGQADVGGKQKKRTLGVATRPSGPDRWPVGMQHSFEDGKLPFSVRSLERCYLPVAAVQRDSEYST